jgi:hypothetical protein
VGHTSLIPQKIESLGVTFTVATQAKILWLLIGVVIYYTLAFILYAAGDALTLFREIHQRSEESKARRRRLAEQERLGSLGLDPSGMPKAGDAATTAEDVILAADDSWRLGGLVPATTRVRWFFDYVVPVLIAGYAIWCLVTAAPLVPGGSEPLPDWVEWSSPSSYAARQV